MKSTILSIALVAVAGLCFGLALTGCASDNLGAASSSVTGVGDTCVQNTDCNAGLECEHGSCQQHNHGKNADAGAKGDEGDDDNGDNEDHPAADGGVQTACQLATDCAAGQECDDGFCKDHGGDDGGGDDGGHHGGGEGSDG